MRRPDFAIAHLLACLALSKGADHILFVLVGLPFRDKPWYRQRVVMPASAGIAAVGLYWAVTRFLASVA